MKVYDYNYILTVTFKSMRQEKKWKIIDNFPQLISKALGIIWGRSKLEAVMHYTIEYHKKKHGEFKGYNNVTAPHIHGIISFNKCLSQQKQQEVYEFLSKYMGRTQFYLQEDFEEIEGWWEYCSKEVNANNEDYQRQHGFENVNIRMSYMSEDDFEEMYREVPLQDIDDDL